MEFIEWRPTPDRNVEVLNNTADLYRYFDCTDEAEFLYGCVKRTVEYDLPHEIDYLRRHDEARRQFVQKGTAGKRPPRHTCRRRARIVPGRRVL
jgi:hypothetical protein